MRFGVGPIPLLIFGGALVLGACGDDDTASPPAVDETTSTVVTSSTVVGSSTIEVPVAEEPVAEPAPAAEYDFSAVAPIVEEFIADRELNGAGLIVVDRDDGVIHHDHWGVFDEDRISLIASSSKMVSAGVLMRLHDDGLLDIDAPVEDVVDWGIGNPDITPAQLVSNSSGLVGLGPDLTYGPYLCQWSPDDTLQSCGETIFATPDDDADIVAPDSQFRYGGGQWQVAGAVAEAASGKTWAELIEEIYVEPCGLDVLAFDNPFLQLGADISGYPAGFNADPSTLTQSNNPSIEAGAYVTTGDYGKLLLMHLRDGMCEETQVLSPEALDRLHSDRILQEYGGSAGPETGYAMGWWVDRSTGRISDGGAFGTVPWLDLEDGYGAYLVIESNSQTGAELAGLLYDVVEAAVVG